MVRPNLFIVGAPKCGTTAWYEYLRRHKDISFAPSKEPHYFCEDFPDFRWARKEEHYLSLFSSLPAKKYVGEASVMYMYSSVAAKLIAEFNPEARVLAFVRSYDSFIPSYHSQLVVMHEEDEETVKAAWDLQGERSSGRRIPTTCREPKFLQYTEVAGFGEQLLRFSDYLPRSNLRVLEYEKWVKDPRAAYRKIMQFLDLPDDGYSDFHVVNTARRYRNRYISRILHRPPSFVMRTAAVVRKILGIRRLNIARKIRVMNEVSRSSTSQMDEEFREEILSALASDKEILNEMLRVYGL